MSRQLPFPMSSTSSIVPGLHSLVGEGMGHLWQRLELWGGGWVSPAYRAWGKEEIRGYLLLLPWPPHSPRGMV